MNHVEVIQDTPDSPVEASDISHFGLLVLDKLGIENWSMSVLTTDDAGITAFNKRWRGKNSATDVLSFAQCEGIPFPGAPERTVEAGDIVISLESVARNAGEQGLRFDQELRRVIIHGILHLDGMDHEGDDYSRGMLSIQEEILAETSNLMRT